MTFFLRPADTNAKIELFRHTRSFPDLLFGSLLCEARTSAKLQVLNRVLPVYNCSLINIFFSGLLRLGGKTHNPLPGVLVFDALPF